MLSAPTGVTGWTVLDTTTSGTMQTRVYTKIATAADANKRVTVTLDAAAKYTMTVADYSGVRPGRLVYADFAETVIRAGHPTPTVDAPAGSWVVSYWADKSAATTGFALPGSVTGRQALCSTGHRTRLQLARRLQRRGADRVSTTAWWPRPTRPTRRRRPGRSSCAPSSRTRLRRRRSPTPATAPTATSTAPDSSDPDGSVVSYAWDFGDGGTATGATASHDFVTSGTRNVTLTVTDDEGTPGSLVVPVSVVRTNAAPDGIVHGELHIPGLQLRRERLR